MPEQNDDPVCPSCRQAIPFERLDLHLAGLDGARPECPRQDLVEIAQRAREEQMLARHTRLWQPWTRAWT